MKQRYVIFCALISLSAMLSAQEVLLYSYDANGNRILREVIMLKRFQGPLPLDSTTIANTSITAQDLDSINTTGLIHAFPNPTDGDLIFESSNGESLVEIKVYSMNSVLLFEQKVIGNKSYTVDLSPYPKGRYLCYVSAEAGREIFIIIKE